MKNLKEALGGREFSTESKEEWFQLAGKEMTAFFGKNCYWVFYKYPREAIERAYDIAKKENNKDFSHYLNNVVRG